jgi:hypothetical protein
MKRTLLTFACFIALLTGYGQHLSGDSVKKSGNYRPFYKRNFNNPIYGSGPIMLHLKSPGLTYEQLARKIYFTGPVFGPRPTLPYYLYSYPHNDLRIPIQPLNNNLKREK